MNAALFLVVLMRTVLLILSPKLENVSATQDLFRIQVQISDAKRIVLLDTKRLGPDVKISMSVFSGPINVLLKLTVKTQKDPTGVAVREDGLVMGQRAAK